MNNMQEAMTNAAMNAKSPNALEQRNQAAAKASKATPTTAQPSMADVMAMMQAQQAQMAQLAELISQKDAQIAQLQAAKPASKAAPKSPIACKNCTWQHDAKAGTLTIVVDLNANILDDAGNPKVSSTGNTTGVAQLSGSLTDKTGRKVGLSLNAYHKL